jgi:hypothetical protein
MMLLALRPEFRKLRFQMIADKRRSFSCGVNQRHPSRPTIFDVGLFPREAGNHGTLVRPIRN